MTLPAVSRRLAAWLLAFSLAPAAALAQGLGIGTGSDDKPLEVFADQGIEWRQNDNTYIARGNARAIKGDTTVYGDTLLAHYRKTESGGTEIWRLEATGNVRIASPTDTAYGDRAVYTLDNAVLVLTGKALRLTTPRQTITARDSLEYWEQKDLAVARGNGLVVTDDGRRIRGDVLTAQFKSNKTPAGTAATTAKPATAKPATTKPGATQKPAAPAAQRGNERNDSRMQRIDAYGNVIITTPQEVARGNRAVYLEETGIANLIGSVKITRGQNQLNGEAAEVNLRTGVSRIVSATSGTSGGPVRALIVPDGKAQGGGATPPAPAPRN